MSNLFEITSKLIISHYFYFNIHSLSSYPPVFTEKQFRKFLQTYIPQSSFVPFLNHQKQYQLLRQNITARLTLEKANLIETTTRLNKEKDSAHMQLQEKHNHSATSNQISSLFITHMKDVFHPSNETCIISMIKHSSNIYATISNS